MDGWMDGWMEGGNHWFPYREAVIFSGWNRDTCKWLSWCRQAICMCLFGCQTLLSIITAVQRKEVISSYANSVITGIDPVVSPPVHLNSWQSCLADYKQGWRTFKEDLLCSFSGAYSYFGFLLEHVYMLLSFKKRLYFSHTGCVGSLCCDWSTERTLQTPPQLRSN